MDTRPPWIFNIQNSLVRTVPNVVRRLFANARRAIRLFGANYHVEGVISMDDPVPVYCHSCGNAYPWTHTAPNSAKELVEELDQLDREEKDKLNGSIGELVRDSPQAQVAAVRFKKLIKKAGGPAADAIRRSLMDLASEAIKKQIF